MHFNTSHAGGLQPVEPSARMVHVDVVRGFALFGVLLVNMFNFGAWSPAWSAPLDTAVQGITRFCFETKSWRLFSFLFGLGFAIQLLRSEERGASFLPTYGRRLLVLFGFGAANALLYSGDILMIYAELGVLLILCRRAPCGWLPGMALALLLVFPLGNAVTAALAEPGATSVPAELERELARQSLDQQLLFHPYAVGDLHDVIARNLGTIPPNPAADLLDPESSLALFAMFLLGLYAGRRRILEDPQAYRLLIRRVCRWGLAIGIACMALERALALTLGYQVFHPARIAWLPELAGDLAFTLGSTALALGYAGVLIIAWQRQLWRGLLVSLAAAGRMALSVYLLQTLMFTTLFYGYGFGQFNRLGPAGVAGFAVVFFIVQIGFARWWLAHFRYGPAEWLWRSLSYGALQPFRRDPPAADQSTT